MLDGALIGSAALPLGGTQAYLFVCSTMSLHDFRDSERKPCIIAKRQEIVTNLELAHLHCARHDYVVSGLSEVL